MTDDTGLVFEDADDDAMPSVHVTRKRALLFGFFVVSVVAFLYFVLPHLSGLSDTTQRIRHGDPKWMLIAAMFEILSFGGYVALFRTVFVRDHGDRVDWLASYEITMAGLAATRLFATAGAGGIALTAWALRRAGLPRREVACRIIAFMVALYAVFMGSLVVAGVGLALGVFNGSAPFGITVIPAIVGGSVIVLFLIVALLPGDVERRMEHWAGRGGRIARIMARLSTVPASAAMGVRTTLRLIREREIGLLGAVAWWYFDIAVLWSCFHAFGADPPPFWVIVTAYFVGMVANTLPLPGGIGGVDGGMIGAFAAFDVPFHDATIAVLVYRGFAFWLPTLPGAIAYFQLRRTVAHWEQERNPVAPGGTIQSKVST